MPCRRPKSILGGLACRRPKIPNDRFTKKYGDGDMPSLPIEQPRSGGGAGEGNQFKIVFNFSLQSSDESFGLKLPMRFANSGNQIFKFVQPNRLLSHESELSSEKMYFRNCSTGSPRTTKQAIMRWEIKYSFSSRRLRVAVSLRFSFCFNIAPTIT